MIRAITLALCLLTLVSAGPHGHTGSSPRRRHHHRAKRYANPAGLSARVQPVSVNAKRDCDEGAWQCVGTELQRCNYDAWSSVANCTGDDIVCSADSRAVGCIWSWSIDNAAPVVATHISVAEPLPTLTSMDAGSTTDDSFAHASVTSAAESASASDASESGAAGAVIGGNLWAGADGSDNGDATTSRRHGHKSSTQDWYAAPTYGTWSSAASSTATDVWSDAASATASSASDDEWTPTTTDWYQSVPTVTASAVWGSSASASDEECSSASSSDDWDASTSASDDWNDWQESISTRSSRHSKTSTAGSQPTGSSGSSGPSGSFGAPHYVIYADSWLTRMPSASDLSSYNRFILAFWMAQREAVDNAQAWEQFDADYRQQVLDEYHAAGIALMVSAFGATDSPTSDGQDPTDVATRLAAWVKQYGLDGVDIDYEDMPAMNSDQAEAWLITFQTKLRELLPAPYLISHAPVAPWFTSGNNYPSGAYVAVHKQTGSGIDWYNVQFYNQGSGVYEDCNSLIDDSGSAWPDTSVMGINSHAGVALNKIVIGKPLDAGAAANGYVDGSLLATCVAQAQSQGWNAGVMFWEWAPSIAGNLMATVRGS